MYHSTAIALTVPKRSFWGPL